MRAIMSFLLLVGGLLLLGSSRSAETVEPLPDALSSPVRTAAVQTPEDEVLAVVEALFDAMRDKDGERMATFFHSDARLTTTAGGDDGATVQSTPISTWLEGVASAEIDLDERIGGERILVDAGLATAWTPYAFFAGGEFSHCGVNAFQLVRLDDGWKVLQVTDTRRRDDCPEGAPR